MDMSDPGAAVPVYSSAGSDADTSELLSAAETLPCSDDEDADVPGEVLHEASEAANTAAMIIL